MPRPSGRLNRRALEVASLSADVLQAGSLGEALHPAGLPRACIHMHIHDELFFRAREKISLENCSSRAELCFQVFCLSQKKIADAMKSFVQP